MQANPSSRWKNEILPVVENHDFGLKNVYDAGPGFRQEDHQCDFCGTHLRYAAVIEAESEPIEYKVGLDCLEYAMGSAWSHMQDVERQINELKEEAKQERRQKEYAEQYAEEIEWLETYLSITEDEFLEEMHEVLTTGSRVFSKRMHDSVLQNMKNKDLDKVRKKEEWIETVIERLESLLEMIENSDKNDGGWSFVNSVLEFAKNKRTVTDNQLEAVNDVHNRYKEYEEQEEEDVEKLPF